MKRPAILGRSAEAAFIAALAMGVSTAAQAAPITGSFTATSGSMTVSAGIVDWQPNPPSGAPTAYTGPIPAVGTYGAFVVSAGAPRTGSFLDPVFGTEPSPGIVKDLSTNPLSSNYFPVNTAVSIVNFLRLQEKAGPGIANDWQFNANLLAGGTLPGTPFSFENSGNSVILTMTVSGLACYGTSVTCDPVDPDTSPWTGVFRSQYTNTNADALIRSLQAGGSLDNVAWSATITVGRTSDVPEPGTVLLAGLAAACLSRARRTKAV